MPGEIRRSEAQKYLPVFSITLKHQWIFRLANLPIISILDLFHVLLRLYTLILGKRTMMSLLE